MWFTTWLAMASRSVIKVASTLIKRNSFSGICGRLSSEIPNGYTIPLLYFKFLKRKELVPTGSLCLLKESD